MPENRQSSERIEQGPLVLSPDRFTPDNRSRLSGPGLRAFLNISRAWGLNENEKRRVLGEPSRSTFHKWASNAEAGRRIKLSVDTLSRISAVLGVHKNLQIIFGDEEEGLRWLRSPNRAPCFGNQRPIDVITSGTQEGIILVRRYLDAWRGGTFAAPTEAPFERQPWDRDSVTIVQ
jgi:uncharacterized protein (DUF2384 family)